MRRVQIRPATRADVAQVIDVCRRSWLSVFAQIAPFELVRHWAMRDWYASHCAEFWPRMTVAQRGDAVVGVVEPLVDEINGLWLLPSAQRRGIGSRLLAAGEAQIRAAGHRRACVSCAAINAGALVFYRKRGYVERRRTVHHIEAMGLDETMVELERRFDEA